MPAIAKIVEALDVSADWLILGREPNIDKETLMIVLEYFDDVVHPQIASDGIEAAAEAFLKFYERVYIHHYSLPGVEVVYQKRGKSKGQAQRGKPKRTR